MFAQCNIPTERIARTLNPRACSYTLKSNIWSDMKNLSSSHWKSSNDHWLKLKNFIFGINLPFETVILPRTSHWSKAVVWWMIVKRMTVSWMMAIDYAVARFNISAVYWKKYHSVKRYLYFSKHIDFFLTVLSTTLSISKWYRQACGKSDRFNGGIYSKIICIIMFNNGILTKNKDVYSTILKS